MFKPKWRQPADLIMEFIGSLFSYCMYLECFYEEKGCFVINIISKLFNQSQ